jgi:regulator of replication initiation timing
MRKNVNTKIPIAILSIFLMTSLCANALQHLSNDTQRNEFANIANKLDASQWQVRDLETEKASLQIQIANLTTQVSSLQNQTSDISSKCSNITSEIVNLQTENDNLKRENTDLQNQLYEKGPRLITKLGTTDVKIDHTAYHSNQTRLFIEGEVWNIGDQVANDCRLHVILYQGSNVANDTYIQLGTINAIDCVNVRTDIYYYTGQRLTNWKITPEYN